jgi:probable addiction module antidote protein
LTASTSLPQWAEVSAWIWFEPPTEKGVEGAFWRYTWRDLNSPTRSSGKTEGSLPVVGLSSPGENADQLGAFAFEERDASLLAAALGDIARAKGMTEVARNAGLGRESLYKALSPDGNPELATVMKVIEALGLGLHAKAG